MVIFTHLKIGFSLYGGIRGKQDRQAFRLDPVRFIYGNVKPDISEMASSRHHLSETYDCFMEHWLKATDVGLTSGVRSEALGVAAHFVSDYFCLYHAKAPYNQRGIFPHLIYECRLHLSAEWTSFKRLVSGKSQTLGCGLRLEGPVGDRILALLRGYQKGEESCSKDLMYAYTALELLMESVLCSLEMEGSHANSHLHRYIFASGERGDQYA